MKVHLATDQEELFWIVEKKKKHKKNRVMTGKLLVSSLPVVPYPPTADQCQATNHMTGRTRLDIKSKKNFTDYCIVFFTVNNFELGPVLSVLDFSSSPNFSRSPVHEVTSLSSPPFSI